MTRTSSDESDPKEGNAPQQDKEIYDQDNSNVGQDNLEVDQGKKESVWKGKDNDHASEPVDTSGTNKIHDHKSDRMPEKLLEQLDEAQFLVKSAVSTGQSKEARLARVCAGLSSRLQEYKAENAQLEEVLMRERGRSSSYEASIKQLEQDLLLAQMEMSKVESSMGDALTAKNAEIEKLVGSIDAFKKQASTADGKLVSLQANMDALMRGRELSETRVIQALREELAAAERRAEEERIAHNATKMAAVEREVELEHRAVEASNALVRMQVRRSDIPFEGI
ncbi:golgin-84-like isoform X1 [Wolffia australiana]